MKLKVKMYPGLDGFEGDESGIRRVVEAYHRYAEEFDVEYVDHNVDSYDLIATHAGCHENTDVAITHGLYWTDDYPSTAWEWRTNANVIGSMLMAYEVTVPSNWVAETLRRDLRINPHILKHGIEWDQWQFYDIDRQPFVLWNKNRTGDVCDPTPIVRLADRFRSIKFVTTFSGRNAVLDLPNLSVIGLQAHSEMKSLVMHCGVYLSTTKETFGIGVLEAMASGVPVLGYAFGGNLDLVKHGVNGYLAKPGDLEDLSVGLEYCMKHNDVLGENGREMAKSFTWRESAQQLRLIYDSAYQKKTDVRPYRIDLTRDKTPQ